MTRFDHMCAHYVKKIIIPCFACLFYANQYHYSRCTPPPRSASITVAVQYDTRSDTSVELLCQSTLSITTLANEGSEIDMIFLGVSDIGLIVGMYIVTPAVVVWQVGKRTR